MSSYVIEKRDYIRCAGLLAGIADYYNKTPRELWIFDHGHGRNMTTPDYHEAFSHLYDLNAESVQEQYGDDMRETDTNTYDDDFKKYFAEGRKTAFAGSVPILKVVKKLNEFFRSALYQTEKRESAHEMQRFFWCIMTALISRITSDDETHGFWGAFNEDEDPPAAQANASITWQEFAALIHD